MKKEAKKLNNIYNQPRYYSSFTDDFMNTKTVKNVVVDEKYPYIPKNPFVRFFRNVMYYTLGYPGVKIIDRLHYGVKIYGKKNLKGIKGALIVGNHSNAFDGSFAIVEVSGPKKCYVVANKDAIEVPVARFFTKSFGALPVPDTTKGLANLNKSVVKLLEKGNRVAIFPEAHIWPYYTGLRPFSSVGFHYAVKANVPVVPFVVTYRLTKGKNKFKKLPKVNLTILNPIYPDKSKTLAENKAYLAEQAYNQMKEALEKANSPKLFEYIKKDE